MKKTSRRSLIILVILILSCLFLTSCQEEYVRKITGKYGIHVRKFSDQGTTYYLKNLVKTKKELPNPDISGTYDNPAKNNIEEYLTDTESNQTGDYFCKKFNDFVFFNARASSGEDTYSLNLEEGKIDLKLKELLDISEFDKNYFLAKLTNERFLILDRKNNLQRIKIKNELSTHLVHETIYYKKVQRINGQMIEIEHFDGLWSLVDNNFQTHFVSEREFEKREDFLIGFINILDDEFEVIKTMYQEKSTLNGSLGEEYFNKGLFGSGGINLGVNLTQKKEGTSKTVRENNFWLGIKLDPLTGKEIGPPIKIHKETLQIYQL